MGHYYADAISEFFTVPAFALKGKQRPATTLPTKFLETPAPQTSLIFKLPDELILSILSHIAPDPRLTGRYPRFRIQYTRGISSDDYHHHRVQFLRPLSMTCKALRLRLLSWIWERLSVLQSSWGSFERTLITVVNASHTNVFLAASVRFMTVDLPRCFPTPLFVKCLVSLPNLHTLEIGWMNSPYANSLTEALKGVELPQIKTLILPPAAGILLRHCHNVEDVVCVVGYKITTYQFDIFFGCLISNKDSKVKQLAIPLVLWNRPSPSVFVAACPRLTELTIIYPDPIDAHQTLGTGIIFDPIGGAPSAVLELITACNALPDFDTLQIVHLPSPTPSLMGCGCNEGVRGRCKPSREQLNQTREEVKGLRDWAIDCLKKSEMGEGGKRTTLRAIRLDRDHPFSGFVEVEVYEV